MFSSAFLLFAVVLFSNEFASSAALNQLFARSAVETPVQQSAAACHHAFYSHSGCMTFLNDYMQLLYNDDFVGAANSVETVCRNHAPKEAGNSDREIILKAVSREEFPKTVKCLEEAGCDMWDSPNEAAYVNILCEKKDDLQAALGCWEAGFQQQLTVCRDEAMNMESSPGFDTCRFIETFRTCLRNWLEQTPACDDSASNVVEGLFSPALTFTECD